MARPVGSRETSTPRRSDRALAIALRMDKKEALSILAEHLARYRSRSYAKLASWARQHRIDTPEAAGPSGTRYQIEVQFFWDGKPEGDVRVGASIDDGGIRAFFPLTGSFILRPEGKFVGE